jgi:hypothetical protein
LEHALEYSDAFADQGFGHAHFECGGGEALFMDDHAKQAQVFHRWEIVHFL